MPRSHKTVKDKLDEALNVANTEFETHDKPIVEILPPVKPNTLIKASRPDDVHPETQEDYEYARAKYRELIEVGSEALEGLTALAQESEHPRTYEVLGELMSAVTGVVNASIILQEKMDKLRGKIDKPNNSAPLQAGDTNIIFQGSNKDLLDVIQQARDAKSKKKT